MVSFICSAGVGRTGALIAIDIALSQAFKEKQVDIPKIIVNMRRQRMKMVQTVVRKFRSGADLDILQGGPGLLLIAQNCNEGVWPTFNCRPSSKLCTQS